MMYFRTLLGLCLLSLTTLSGCATMKCWILPCHNQTVHQLCISERMPQYYRDYDQCYYEESKLRQWEQDRMAAALGAPN